MNDLTRTLQMYNLISILFFVLGICFIGMAVAFFIKYRIWETLKKKTLTTKPQKTKKSEPKADKPKKEKKTNPEPAAEVKEERKEATPEPVSEQPEEEEMVHFDESTDVLLLETEVLQPEEMNTDVLMQDTEVLEGDTEMLAESHKAFTITKEKIVKGGE